MEKHPLHIKIPELQKSEEVEDAVLKHERLEEEKLPNDATERIETYMSRLENIFLNSDARVRERNLEMLRENIYDAFIIKPEDVPEEYFELQQRVARERGQAVEEIPQNVREQMIGTIIEDQKKSLDNWIEYLTSEDAVYPTWFKYFVFRNITKLSQFDKTLGKFKERTKNTTAPFPDIYREPLAQMCDVYEQVARDNKALKDEEVQKIFSRKFSTVYAEKIQESLAASIENKEGIEGEWVKYEQGSKEDAQRLYNSLQSKGTGWCTAGQSTAKTQIESGDFYVYYTYDTHNEPTQPRIAIRMNGQNEIGEVRGILEHQSLEPQMNEVLEKKLSEFGPEADKYKKKTADMRELTLIEKKTKGNASLTKEELEFLYEVNAPIEGFGYQKDPRIEEIRKQRNVKEDLPVLFGCTGEQIATNQSEVNENTVAYVGKLYPNIFKQLPQHIEHVYTTFPEGKILIKEIEIPAEEKTPERYEKELLAQGFKLSDYGKDILQRANLKNGSGTRYKIVVVSNDSLGVGYATRQQSLDAAQKLGLAKEKLPARIGPELRLSYKNQPMNEYILMDMENILGRDGDPIVFNVVRHSDGAWLDASSGRFDSEWDGYVRWAFLLSKG